MSDKGIEAILVSIAGMDTRLNHLEAETRELRSDIRDIRRDRLPTFV